MNCSRTVSVLEGTDVSLICMVGSFRHQRWCDGRVVERKQWKIQTKEDIMKDSERLKTSIPYGGLTVDLSVRLHCNERESDYRPFLPFSIHSQSLLSLGCWWCDAKNCFCSMSNFLHVGYHQACAQTTVALMGIDASNEFHWLLSVK